MTTKLENNTILRVNSLESQDFNKEVNSAYSNSVCPHMIDSGKHKVGCQQESTNLQNKHNSICSLPLSKDTYPTGEVSVEFAAKQLFQILLVHVKYIHSKSVRDIELLPVPSESNPLIINI